MAGILNDTEITALARGGMITPFEPSLIRQNRDGDGVISYGLSSYGYDLRLSPRDFRLIIPGATLDPKRPDPNAFAPVPLRHDDHGSFFVMPPHSYGLGVAMERLNLPDNVTGLCVGKSTYARNAIIANVTPGEAAWRGHLTLEFSNPSPAHVRLYAGEGIIQVVFLVGNPCAVSYGDRAGKYQDQPEAVILSKV